MSEGALPALPRRSNNSVVVALTALAAVEALIFVLCLAVGVQGFEIVMVALALLTAFVGSLPVILDFGRPAEERQLMLSLTSLVYMIFLAVPPFTNYFPMKGEFIPGTFRLSHNLPVDIAHAQVVALFGLIALLIGFYAPFARFAVSVVPRPTRDWSPRAALAVAVVTLVLGWIVYVAGNFGLIPSRAGSGIFGTIAGGSFFGISLLALTWLRHRRREALMLLLIVVPMAMLFNFSTGSKRLFLTPPFMVALAFMIYERRIRTSWVVAGLLALIVLYPVSNVYRDVVWVGDGSRTLAFFQNPGRVFQALASFTGESDAGSYLSAGLQSTGIRLDGLSVLTVIVRDTPDRVPYQGGWTIGYIFLLFVPRLIWPNKPGTTIGEWVSQNYGSAVDLHTDVGPTWMGEFFFNWGYPGVILGMFVLGILCRVLQDRLFRWNAPIPALFCAVGALYWVTRNVQSGLITPVTGVIFVVLPVVIAHVLVGMFGGFRPVEDKGTASPAAPTAR